MSYHYNYILDFYCHEKLLAVELDGSQHMEQTSYDEKRKAHLLELGIKVIRFWDNDVLQNIEGVLEQISITLASYSVKKPHPDPLLKGEGNET